MNEVKENEKYSIEFESGGNLLTISVILGIEFPNENPTIIISPAVQHPWCNYSGVIDKAPGFLNVYKKNAI